MIRTGFRPTLHFRRGLDGVFVESDGSVIDDDTFWYYPAYGGTFWYPREKGPVMVATHTLSDEEFYHIYEQLSCSFGIVEVVGSLIMADTSFPVTPLEDWELYRD